MNGILHLQDISSQLEEDYTNIHFPKAHLCSKIKTSGHFEQKHVEEDVQYSEVSFRPSTASRSATALLPFILKLLSLFFHCLCGQSCTFDFVSPPPYSGQLVTWRVLMQSTAQSSRNLSFVFSSPDVVLLVK